MAFIFRTAERPAAAHMLRMPPSADTRGNVEGTPFQSLYSTSAMRRPSRWWSIAVQGKVGVYEGTLNWSTNNSAEQRAHNTIVPKARQRAKRH